MSTLWEIYHSRWKPDTLELLVKSANSGRYAVITGMRPEDEDGGCMATGTPAVLYGREMDDDGIRIQKSWWGAPFGLDENYNAWHFVDEAKKPPVVTTQSIDQHHIEKLKGDVWFWKCMFLAAMILNVLVFLTGCEIELSKQVSGGCQRTEEEARDAVLYKAFAECYPKGWRPHEFIRMNRCVTTEYLGWSADGEITCE